MSCVLYETCSRKDILLGIPHKPFSSGVLFDGNDATTFHHIVPKNKLVSIWDKAVCSGIPEHRLALLPIVEAISGNYQLYDHIRVSPINGWNFVDLFNLGSDLMTSESKLTHPALFKFMEAYAWAPANLMQGPPPDQRTNDPGSYMEMVLCWAMGCAKRTGPGSFIPLCTLLRAAYGSGMQYLIDHSLDSLIQFSKYYAAVLENVGGAGLKSLRFWDRVGYNAKNMQMWTENNFGVEAFRNARLCAHRPGISYEDPESYPTMDFVKTLADQAQAIESRHMYGANTRSAKRIINEASGLAFFGISDIDGGFSDLDIAALSDKYKILMDTSAGLLHYIPTKLDVAGWKEMRSFPMAFIEPDEVPRYSKLSIIPEISDSFENEQEFRF